MTIDAEVKDLTAKQKLSYIVTEAMGIHLLAEESLGKLALEDMTIIVRRSHREARVAAEELAEGDEDLKKLGKVGMAPTMAVFYKNSADELTLLAADAVRTRRDNDREMLLMVADARRGIACALVHDFARAKGHMGDARLRGLKLLQEKLEDAAIRVTH